MNNGKWRDGRVVEGARLEIVCAPKAYRGFESLSLRHYNKALPSGGLCCNGGKRNLNPISFLCIYGFDNLSNSK